MCGITGINWVDKSLVERMNASIRHRGNDDQGVYAGSGVTLGHQRLSILDLSPRGHQPMFFGELAIVFNGEVYNFKELRAELEVKGYSFESTTDTEVMLKAYHAWGQSCVERFDGIFAFAIWDEKKQELFLARDHMGVKPLFYYWHKGVLLFASEIKALLEPDVVDRSIVPDRISFVHRMSGLPGDLTMHKYIFQLPAAHTALLRKGELSVKKYWSVKNFTDIQNKKEIETTLRELLTTSVRRQMISDVPVGVFLSGGFDSSIVAMLAGRESNKQLKTFSVGFEIDTEYDKYNDDFFLARKTAAHFNTDHHELFLKRGQALEYLRTASDTIDMPNSMTTAVPSYWLSQFAKQHVSVVLGGDGGDELFGGYPRYQLSLLLSQWFSLPEAIRRVMPVQLFAQLSGKKNLVNRLRRSSYIDRYTTLKFHHDEDAASVFQSGMMRPELVDEYTQKHFFAEALPTSDFEKYFMNVDLQTWLVDHSLLRSDKTTMAFALEERVPILDRSLVEFAARIPTKYKLSLTDTKIIYKETFRQDLPAYLYQQPKRGWLSPAAKWLRGELKDFAYDVLSDDYCSDTKEFFDLKVARQLLDQHIDGTRYNLHLLWILITWQLWYRRYIRS